ncbi:hypothetical protein L6258_01440 [Candidatus Parcubacteria bacterium]|nr:hypothetical protein [Candidatus Parcubacteria bacterium]
MGCDLCDRRQYKYCYYSDGTGWCDTKYQGCRDYSSTCCPTPTPTPSPTPAPGSVSGRVWDDGNGNKCLDGSESYLSGAVIKLTLSGTTVTDTRESGGDGSYSFENLAAKALYDLQVFSYPSGYISLTGWNDAADGSCRDRRDSWDTFQITFYVDEGANHRSVGLSANPGSWITVINGDVLSNNGISISLPSDPITYEPYFLAADPDNLGGGVNIARGDIRCFDCESPAKINERDWNVKNYSDWGDSVPWPSILDEITESEGDVEYHSEALTISSDRSDQKVVVVDGDITIGGDVTEIKAILISRGTITIKDSGANKALEVTGALYAKDGFNLLRTLNNNRRPAIVVKYDPGFLTKEIPSLSRVRLSWYEDIP